MRSAPSSSKPRTSSGEIEQKVEEGVGTLNDSVQESRVFFILTRVTGSEAYRRFDYWHSAPIAGISLAPTRGVVQESPVANRFFDKLGRVSAASKVFGEGLDAMAVVLEFASASANLVALFRCGLRMRSGDTWDTKSARRSRPKSFRICLRSATLEWKSMILGGLSVAGWGWQQNGARYSSL